MTCVVCTKSMKLKKLYRQALIWALYASECRIHPLFQKVMKNLFSMKSPQNTFEQGYCSGLLPFWSSEVLFSKMSALFIPVNITIIFYSFLLVWITFLPWQIILQTLKLFTVNGYYMITHWKIKHMFLSTSILSIFINFTIKHRWQCLKP